eukprot:CAMPEP_0168483970 /NCGR_PEP_ID=MMETSP0228-20121227/65849_1 /TAXON_ID=133427 /ORGANISM="Protoceratium reticulatum, Strain CCCM 535 (=CCMP 1889)" /LENGTH=44 /DNA_ID= /DNA_START= /DNA_END= /DNA_ORIENTATION=
MPSCLRPACSYGESARPVVSSASSAMMTSVVVISEATDAASARA